MQTTTSPRRTFVNIAEAIRVADLPNSEKVNLANAVVKAEKKNDRFDAERFVAHALSTNGDEKWAYNKATGEGPTA